MSRVIHRFIVNTRDHFGFRWFRFIYTTLCLIRVAQITGIPNGIWRCIDSERERRGRDVRESERKKCKKLCCDMIKTQWKYNWNFSCSSQQQHILLISTICLSVSVSLPLLGSALRKHRSDRRTFPSEFDICLFVEMMMIIIIQISEFESGTMRCCSVRQELTAVQPT